MLFQVNRTQRGWVIELVNNNGVVKFPAKPAVTDEHAVASVVVESHREGQRFLDWRTGETLKAIAGKLQIEVGPGSSTFVEILEASP